MRGFVRCGQRFLERGLATSPKLEREVAKANHGGRKGVRAEKNRGGDRARQLAIAISSWKQPEKFEIKAEIFAISTGWRGPRSYWLRILRRSPSPSWGR